MIEHRGGRFDPATHRGYPPADRDGRHSIASPPEGVAAPVGPFTPYERVLIWCVLTLLGTQGTPSPGRSDPTARLPDRFAPARPAAGRLTTREAEVLGLVALGLTNAQIAARLFVSRRTIDQHLSSIYNRLGVSSRAAATRYAILNGLC